MRSLLALALTLIFSAPALAEVGDAEWFYRNPLARHDQLAVCRNDRRVNQRLCQNAERAETRAYEERLRGRRHSDPVSPITRDAIEIACRQPPGQRGLLGAYCPGRRT